MKADETPVYDFSAKAPETKKYDLSKCMVEFNDEISEPEGLLFLGVFLVLSRGNISTIKGKAKSRKSFFCAWLIEQVFKQNPDITVLLVDTEQSKSFVYKVLKRVYRLMGWTKQNNSLKVLSLREYNVSERKDIFMQAVTEFKSDFIVLDGEADLVADFNNADESKQIVGLLMKLSTEYNCHIVNVAHEGKSNGELRGHNGAELLNKSECVFDIIKDGEQSIVKPYATRNPAFDEFSFMVDENGLPRYCGTVDVKQNKADALNDKMKLHFTKLLAPAKVVDYETLTSEYAELAGCSERTAKSHISKMRTLNFIRKADVGGYCLTTVQVD